MVAPSRSVCRAPPIRLSRPVDPPVAPSRQALNREIVLGPTRQSAHKNRRGGSAKAIVCRLAGVRGRVFCVAAFRDPRPQLFRFGQPGRDSSARSGACSVYESDSAGPLANRRESDDRQAPRDRIVGARVVAAFMPKQNSAQVATTAGRSNDLPRPEIGESRDSARRPGSAVLRCFRGYRGSRPPSAQGRAQPWQSARSAPAIGTIEVSPPLRSSAWRRPAGECDRANLCSPSRASRRKDGRRAGRGRKGQPDPGCGAGDPGGRRPSHLRCGQHLDRRGNVAAQRAPDLHVQNGQCLQLASTPQRA